MAMVYGSRDDGPRQRFVEVDVRHTLDGMLIPLRINWSDGRVFEIAGILPARAAGVFVCPPSRPSAIVPSHSPIC